MFSKRLFYFQQNREEDVEELVTINYCIKSDKNGPWSGLTVYWLHVLNSL